MNIRLSTLSALLALAVSGIAQVTHGTAEVVSGHVLQPDGRYASVAGTQVNLLIEPIKARRVGEPASQMRTIGGGSVEPAETVVYRNDRELFYFFDPNTCSALDDLTLTQAGVGQPWRRITFGVDTLRTSGDVLWHLNAWTSYVTGRGAGVSAFEQNFVNNFGVRINMGQFGAPGTYKVTVEWPTSGPQIVAPTTRAYFGQTWREFNIFGQGAFLVGVMSPVFSGGGNPQVGASDDICWIDGEPNMVFDETETDFFNGSPNEANFLFQIAVAQTGQTDVIKPISFQWFRGQATGGSVGSLHNIDQIFLSGIRGITANPNEAPLQLVAEGFSSFTNLTQMQLDIVTRVDTVGLRQRSEIFNFSTNQWIELDDRVAPTTDTRVTLTAPGTAGNYVQAGTGTVRARIAWRQVAPTTKPNWGARIDLTNWVTTRP